MSNEKWVHVIARRIDKQERLGGVTSVLKMLQEQITFIFTDFLFLNFLIDLVSSEIL